MRLDGVRCSFIARFAVISLLCFGAACAMLQVFAAGSVERYSLDWNCDDERDDTIERRQEAERKLEWKSPEFHRGRKDSLLHVQVLGINDFHGQLSEGRWVANRPVGGAAVLAAYLEAAQQDPHDLDLSERTFIVYAGNHVRKVLSMAGSWSILFLGWMTTSTLWFPAMPMPLRTWC